MDAVRAAPVAAVLFPSCVAAAAAVVVAAGLGAPKRPETAGAAVVVVPEVIVAVLEAAGAAAVVVLAAGAIDEAGFEPNRRLDPADATAAVVAGVEPKRLIEAGAEVVVAEAVGNKPPAAGAVAAIAVGLGPNRLDVSGAVAVAGAVAVPAVGNGDGWLAAAVVDGWAPAAPNSGGAAGAEVATAVVLAAADCPNRPPTPGAVVAAAWPNKPVEGAAGVAALYAYRPGAAAEIIDFSPGAGGVREAASEGAAASKRDFLGWAAEAVVEKRLSALVVLAGGAPAGVVDPSPPKSGFAGVDCTPEDAGVPRPPNNGFGFAWDVPVAVAPNKPVLGAALVVVGAAVLSADPKSGVAVGAVVELKSEVPVAGF